MKRTEANYGEADEHRTRIIRMRRALSTASISAFSLARERSSLTVFLDLMDSPVREYDRFVAVSLYGRALSFVPLKYQGNARRVVAKVKAVKGVGRSIGMRLRRSVA